MDYSYEGSEEGNISTFVGFCIVLVFASLAGWAVWWYAYSYTPEEPIDISSTVAQLQARRGIIKVATTTSPVKQATSSSSVAPQKKAPEVSSNGYDVKAGKVYYDGKVITGADSKTFVKLPEEYAKDGVRVYYAGESIVGADRWTFVYVDQCFAKDAKRVYFCGEVMTGARPSSCTVKNLAGCEEAME